MERRRASRLIKSAWPMTLCGLVICSGCASKKQRELVQPTRLSGTVEIQPSVADLEQLAKSGQSRAHTVFKMCLDEAGNIASLEFLKKSGLRDWDSQLIEEMCNWKHTPFIEDGVPISACKSVEYLYKPNDDQ